MAHSRPGDDRGLTTLFLALAVWGALGRWVGAQQAPPVAADVAQPGVLNVAPAGEQRVGKYVRIAAPISDKVHERVRRSVESFVSKAKQRGQWPVLIFEIQSGRTEFGRARDLAKYLTGPSLNGATTVAYVPQTLTGHGVLVAAACNEIVMHRDGLNEKTEIGDAGAHEASIDVSLTAGYRVVADGRKTVPLPILLKMLDKHLELLEVETESSREFVLRGDLDELKKRKAVSEPKVVSPAGRAGLFTSAQAQQLGFVGSAVADRTELLQALGLPREALEEDPSVDGDWRSVRVDVVGAISGKTVDTVQKNIEDRIREDDVNFICVYLDSAGGSPVDSSRLAYFLAGLDPQKRRTVAYVPQKARGDAVLIALACDQIVVHEATQLGGSGEAAIDDDALPATIRTYREIAKRKFHSPALAAAMVDPQATVFRYVRKDNGLGEFYTADDAAALPDADKWRQAEEVKSPGEPLMLSGAKGAELGIVHDVVTGFGDFKALYGLENDPQLLERGWARQLIDALNSPGVSLLLLFIGGAALYIELHTPGVGVGGFVGAVCFVLYFWSAYLGGTAGWLEVLLFLMGTTCVLMELFLFPGVAVFGFGGALLIIASLVLASQTYVIPRNQYQMEHLRTSLLVVIGAILGTGAAASILRRFLPHAPMFNRVYLAPPSGDELSQLLRRESLGLFEHLLGRRGLTTTPLVPGGKARFDEELVDVVSEGDFIDRNAPIEVVEVQGTKVVVRATTA